MLKNFLKGSSNSFLNPSISYKNSIVDSNGEWLKEEISWDNPLDMDSNRHSRQLHLEDLQIKRSFKNSLDENYDDKNVEYEQDNINENILSRNNQNTNPLFLNTN